MTKIDALVKNPLCRHCEERSDAAISIFQAVMNCEVAEFTPSVKARLLRLWLAMMSEGLPHNAITTLFIELRIYS